MLDPPTQGCQRPAVRRVGRGQAGAESRSGAWTHLVVVVQPDDRRNAPVLGLVPPLHPPGVGEQPQVVGPHLVGEDCDTCCVEQRLVGVVHQHRLPARQRAPGGHDSGAEEAHGEIRGRDAGRQGQRHATVEGWRRRDQASGRHRPAQQRDCVPPCSCRAQRQAPRVEAASVSRRPRSRRRLPPLPDRCARRWRRDAHVFASGRRKRENAPRRGAEGEYARPWPPRWQLGHKTAPPATAASAASQAAVWRHGPAVAVQGAAGMRQPEHSGAQTGGGDAAAGASLVWAAGRDTATLEKVPACAAVRPGSWRWCGGLQSCAGAGSKAPLARAPQP
jgi:hypothetical protein